MPGINQTGYVKSLEEIKKEVARFNIIDDVFFQKVTEDLGACEELLQILLGRTDISVVSSENQKYLRNAGNKSVVLDLFCKDKNGTLFNVEIQRSDNDDLQKRMRYYISNIDTKSAEEGITYSELPDIYSIMISEFDIFKKDKTVYHISRILNESGEVQSNGIHELYINAKGKDASPISDLMKYFLNSNGYNEKFPKISKRVQYFKEEQEGIRKMGNYSDELRAEGMAQGLEQALKVLGVSKEEYERKLAEKKHAEGEA